MTRMWTGTSDVPDGAVPTVPSHCVARDFGSETVALNTKTGQYHGLKGSAGPMFEALQRADIFADALAEIERAYPEVDPARLRADLLSLCAGLVQRRLLEVELPRSS